LARDSCWPGIQPKYYVRSEHWIDAPVRTRFALEKHAAPRAEHSPRVTTLKKGAKSTITTFIVSTNPSTTASKTDTISQTRPSTDMATKNQYQTVSKKIFLTFYTVTPLHDMDPSDIRTWRSDTTFDVPRAVYFIAVSIEKHNKVSPMLLKRLLATSLRNLAVY
jgi:hypothetical protein